VWPSPDTSTSNIGKLGAGTRTSGHTHRSSVLSRTFVGLSRAHLVSAQRCILEPGRYFRDWPVAEPKIKKTHPHAPIDRLSYTQGARYLTFVRYRIPFLTTVYTEIVRRLDRHAITRVDEAAPIRCV
jgi:hypothetical protein